MSSTSEPTTTDCSSELGRSDRGSAVVDFVLVSALVVVLAAGVIQLALGLHVHNTLVDAAGEGARHAALEGSALESGAARTRTLIGSALAPGYASAVTARTVTVDGLQLVQVEVSAPLPVVGLLGPAGSMTVTGHAVLERRAG